MAMLNLKDSIEVLINENCHTVVVQSMVANIKLVFALIIITLNY